MKPIYLLTGLLAWTTVVVTSCSTPQMAQQTNINDDVYNSTAKAVEYQKPARSQAAQYLEQDSVYNDDYGTSDPYYDMDYYSRINRFYYGSPFRSYYDPYFDGYGGYGGYYGSPYYSGFSLGLGFGYGWNNPYYGGFWGPYSTFGGYYNPYWGYSSWPYGGYLGGGYYGGYFGGGYLGGGYLSGTRGNVTYGGRPARGRENGVGYATGGMAGFGRGGATRTSNGVVVSGRGSSRVYNPNRGATLDSRTRSNTNTMGGRPSRSSENRSTPARTQRYNPPARSERPSYTPPARSSNSGGGMRSSGGGGGGGATRSSRGGRG